MNANQRSSHLGRRALISSAAAVTIAGFGSQLYLAETAKADEPKPMLMFVQLADDLKADPAANTLRLVNVSKQTLYFSDRPVRLAGHLKMADYLEEWTKRAGKDNFGNDPPNATLSVYEPGQADNTLAVVEITNPVIDGADLVYTYKLIDGKMPKSGGATSLFIDWIGLGGGVGRGFHGVGVGLRGPGVL
jgi:hypothetical protein